MDNPNSSPQTDIVPRVGEIVRQEFGAQQTQILAETAASAVAAREQAAVEARYKMALVRRRDTENFRVALLRECRRPGFAAIAEYHRPVGKEYNEDTGEWEEKIATGPSVHLIRTAIALYQNMMVDSAIMFDSNEIRLVHAYVLDLENNHSWARTIAISKLVEKRGFKKKGSKNEWEPPRDRQVVGEPRLNTKGEPVYTVHATEDEIRNKEARLVAIAQRENGRAVLPRDILDNALLVARSTLESEDAADPDAAARKVIDAFAELNIKPSDLSEYLGHPSDRMTPAELKQLRGVFVSIREGDANWNEVLLSKRPVGSPEAAQESAEKQKAELRKAKQSEPKAEPPATNTEPKPSESPKSMATEIPAYESKVGAGKYAGIVQRHLDRAGVQSLPELSPDQISSIMADMEDALRERSKEGPAPVLKFGEKPPSKKGLNL